FATYTLAGHVLDPARILVASQANFGAPIANSNEQEGSFISIDPRGADTIVIPANFASSGGQASVLGGARAPFRAPKPSVPQWREQPIGIDRAIHWRKQSARFVN